MLPYSHRTIPVLYTTSMEIHRSAALQPLPIFFPSHLFLKNLETGLNLSFFGSIALKDRCYKQTATASNLWAEPPPLGVTPSGARLLLGAAMLLPKKSIEHSQSSGGAQRGLSCAHSHCQPVQERGQCGPLPTNLQPGRESAGMKQDLKHRGAPKRLGGGAAKQRSFY